LINYEDNINRYTRGYGALFINWRNIERKGTQSDIGKTVLVSPVPYLQCVKNHTHIAFNSNYGTFLNKLTYSIADFGLVTTVLIAKKWLKIIRKITRKQIKNALLSNKVIYTISPSLFSKRDYWSDNINVLGYQERIRELSWKTIKDLND